MSHAYVFRHIFNVKNDHDMCTFSMDWVKVLTVFRMCFDMVLMYKTIMIYAQEHSKMSVLHIINVLKICA